MRKMRFFSFLAILLCCIAVWGQNDFNPVSPPEPGVAPRRLTLKTQPSYGGSVYGAGQYVPGTIVGLRVSASTGYVFEKWVDEEGNTVSSAGSFNFVKSEDNETLTACFRFAPQSPIEPSDPSFIQYYRLTLAAEVGGRVSGGGKYQSGAKVSLNAMCDEGYIFVNWTNSVGDTISSSRSFSYTITGANETLTAHFRFSPTAPSEPGNPILKHRVTVATEDGGSVYASASRLLEGVSCTIRATANDGYRFRGWYVADTLYTSLSQFSYTMGKKDIDFVALFEFDPFNPDEPSMPTDNKYAFYMMTVVGNPGDVLDVPLYITSLDSLCDISLQVTFPQRLKPNLDEVYINDRAKGYSLSCTAVSDTCYLFTMIGGTLPSGDIELLRFKVEVPLDYATGMSERTKINQVSITDSEGVQQTASTRNGRIAIYRRGDTDKDNFVDVADITTIVAIILGSEEETENADVDGDGTLDVADVTALVEIILGAE
ncbi:MAG: dockerin type I repeat-containing protein [Bacteroidaceae bacterium]|nr:dockerin type I repeat-containing protein [Bacteroidaceae bacterium]